MIGAFRVALAVGVNIFRPEANAQWQPVREKSDQFPAD